jgi:hypothetical protein
MTRHTARRHVARLIILLNTLLLLAGLIAFRYSRLQDGTGHWSPPPPPLIDHFKVHRLPHA